MSSDSRWVSSSSSTDDIDLIATEDGFSNGCGVEAIVALHCPDDAHGDRLSASNDGMSEFSTSDLSLPEVCVSTNSGSYEENMNYEVQQAYRIFTGFLLDKHKGITGPFLQPIGHQDAQHGVGGVRGHGQSQLKQSMCLRRMEERFVGQEYETITEFVADFRLMLENCYRYHGVDHWVSKQAQKLEIMLEQKLTLLSRTLREKTTLAVTSKGRFGAEEERGSGGTSTRRRLAPRSLATITVGGHESIMVQTLRLEEQQRVKEEKRQRELEKKEAEEMSAKEVEEWEQSLLSQASPHAVDTIWELPAIGHFLCLAQTALNLPEIVFFELERCLLMPRCSLLLSKIMSSLLSPSQRRSTVHRRPALPYRRWESELRQRVMGWYRSVGGAHDQPRRAEQLGLCHQFFSTLGEVSPLEEKPFHLLPFYQRLWLLKGLCDHVYETQKDVQDAVLAQPIHECRESILGYDSKENAYIHFPHFCGADLRIYCQSPSIPPAFPFPSILVKRVEKELGTEGEESDRVKAEGGDGDRGRCGGSADTAESDDFGIGKAQTLKYLKRENGDGKEGEERFKSWLLKKEEGSESETSEGDSCEDSKSGLKIHTNSLSQSIGGGSSAGTNLKQDSVEFEPRPKRPATKQGHGFSLDSVRTIKAETQDPCLSVGEHSYTGRSPARSAGLASPTKPPGGPSPEPRSSSCSDCCRNKTGPVRSERHGPCCGAAWPSSESAPNSGEERAPDRVWAKKKKRKKKRGREQPPGAKGEEHGRLQQHVDGTSPTRTEAAKSTVRRVTPTIKRKDKKKKPKAGKKLESSKEIKEEPPVEPLFKLVCTSLEELRELISRTEDELDDLESSKKRLGRWYYRREAVKDLHSTLIRLLNELSPWEPKLVKAYQRNRLRLKKEFDDFKKHPDYNNFVREQCLSSSSSSDDDEERALGKEACSLSDHHRRSEDEDLEHVVPRGLWSGASTREFAAEFSGDRTATCVTPNHLRPLALSEKGVGLSPGGQTGSSDLTSLSDSGPQSRSELIPSNQPWDSHSAWPAQATPSHGPPILHPATGLPKGYTPIPTLLAKSVGNKVTLMKRPIDFTGVNNVDRPSKGSLISLPTSAVATPKLSKAQCSPSGSQQNLQLQVQGPQQSQVLRLPAMSTVTAAPPKSPQDKPTQTVPKSPVQVVYKVPEGLGHLVRKDSGPVKIAVHPVLDQNTGEKVMQQVVILPSKLLIHKNEEIYQQQSQGVQVPVSKATSPLCMSTNVPGFTIPENRIPVQQVAPLKDARTVRTPSPRLQQGAPNPPGFKGIQVCSSEPSTPQGGMLNPSNITTPPSAVSTEPVKAADPKQELKTVCIRDSQSILVTTRGGNTGIVKVQTSSDQNALGCLPTSPVITISPQFKAFLVSKTSSSTPSAPSQTSSCTIPAMTSFSVAHPQKQVLSVVKSPSAVTTPMVNALTGSIPVAGPGSHTAGTTVTLSQGSNTLSTSVFASKTGQLAQTTAPGSPFQASLVKNTVVPSLNSSSAPQVLTQPEFVCKPGVKRASTDERPQVTKFILVTPSSSPASNVAVAKDVPPSAKPIPSSRVMFISQPTATSSATFVGSVPNQVMAAGSGGQLLATQLSSEVKSDALAKVKNITLPTGVQIQLSGKTTTFGQTIGALSHSPSKSTAASVLDAGRSAANTARLVMSSSGTITSFPAQPSSYTCLSGSSQLQGIPPFAMTSQTSTAAPLGGNMVNKDVGLSNCGNSPAQVPTTTMQSSPAQTRTTHFVPQPPNIQSTIGEDLPSIQSSSHLALNKTQICSATTASSPFITSTAGTIQQRIVINTSTPLAAGTQILLNNARFVVPPQGLGPGSHVLILSSPAPQQVPSASSASIGAAVPPQGGSSVTVAPRGPVLPQSPARPSGVSAMNSPFVACTPAIGPSLLATTPNVVPIQLSGTPGLGSTLLPSKTSVVSALTKLPVSQSGNFASSPTLVSSPPRLGSIPALVSPVVTSATGLGSVLATITLAAAATPTQAECSSTTSPVVVPPLPRLSVPLSSLPVLPSPSAAPIIPVPGPISPTPNSPHLHPFPAQQEFSVTNPGPAAVRMAAPFTASSQFLANTSVKKHMAMRTQVLPTVAVPPIVSAVSRMQTLPVAKVPPIGSAVNSSEAAPAAASTPPSTNSVILTPAQPLASLKTNSAAHQAMVLTNQELGKQASALGTPTNVASKLLISPDGAVLSTVQCQVKPAKPLAALVVSPNSSVGALHPHDSSLQPSQADTNQTN